ncbi:hypothetical protein [Megasphaera sp.]|uniref:hypothetical protein n=1 Tax=Megasphaera sp. TaxID=2023260 RepID=UPI0035210CE4
MNEAIKQDVDEQLAGAMAYDKAAKGFLSKKKVLAYILKRTVPEFESVSLDDIADFYIEGTPEVSTVPVYKDKTNAVRQALAKQDTHTIKGAQNEDNSITEGSIVFDILFRAKAPGTDEIITLIINVEAQRNLHPKKKTGGTYPLLKRAVYYASRLISSQKETEFVNSDYDKIKKVYTIWICMEAPDGKSAINRYQLKEQHLLHRYKEPRQNYDLMGIVFVYLGNSKVKDQMMNLLDLMFKSKKKPTEKVTVLKNEFGIDLTQEEEGDLEIMCNLGEGLYEDGKMEGRMESQVESALEMLKDGVSLEKIAQYTKLSLSKIKELAKQNKLI